MNAWRPTTTDFPLREAFLKEDSYIRRINQDDDELARRRVMLRKAASDEQVMLSTAYFPAFRVLMEAWASKNDAGRLNPRLYGRARIERDLTLLSEQTTIFARQLFGSFVPTLNYPSPQQIEQTLTDDIQAAWLELAQTDRQLFAKAFVRIFEVLQNSDAVTESPDEILDEIRGLSSQLDDSVALDDASPEDIVYARVRHLLSGLMAQGQPTQSGAVLHVYRELLRQRIKAQDSSFASIELYLASVNEFLEGKQIEVIKRLRHRSSVRSSALGLTIQGDNHPTSLRVLSSGERQIITLIYAATQMSMQEVVLIDEPELSLHVDWQRKLLKKMVGQLGNRQIIACTHSPIIGADYEEQVKELVLRKSSVNFEGAEQEDEEI